ncbi:MAG: alpha/beta hydrolase [Bacteroidota bacterium]
MKFSYRVFCLLLSLMPLICQAWQTNVDWEEAEAFYPGLADQPDVRCGYLSVPENWDQPTAKRIKLAVVILKGQSAQAASNPMLYLEGGPGAGGIAGLGYFWGSQIQQNSDVVLVDIRGTGFSQPRLCPDLGKKFMEILALDQSPSEDEEQKMLAAMSCKQDLIGRGIDVQCYNSQAVSKDLHALKQFLNYKKWHVYGVSYGTHLAQQYAQAMPQDIQSLVLDSSIPDIQSYYTDNTSNYVQALEKVFDYCALDPECQQRYPNLESTYYATIEKLTKAPIEVKVDRQVLESRSFTYNAEDFKVAIQQALYDERLVAVLPLLIDEFHKGNAETLGAMVRAFSGALELDYGLYYCMTCADVVSSGSSDAYEVDAAKHEKLRGGLSFYHSDYVVCERWLKGVQPAVDSLGASPVALEAPVLIFAGEFDPITPLSNGRLTAAKYPNSHLVEAPRFGHVPSHARKGFGILAEFVANAERWPAAAFPAGEEMRFVGDVAVHGGIAGLAGSLDEFNPVFFGPLAVAILVLFIAFVVCIVSLWKNRQDTMANKGMKGLLGLTSLLGLLTLAGFVWAVQQTAGQNLYILAFGLPQQFSYLFLIQLLFIVVLACSVLYFLLRIRRISNASMIGSVLFSGLLIGVYFQYWGFWG